ncbi:uncharacterized protein LOC126823540 [Patella vulgata]|uniref:uncharacterized protein LOC126823540 n=1 Tax=Patella vulgata TaxID=6465 RepID=UPI00217FB8EF|nr:uncharacterized protein LOC126823540 [Patella vulgata]
MSVFLVIMATICLTAATPYVDMGYPYLDGRLPITNTFISVSKDKSPLHNIVFSPSIPGTYGVYYFIGGLDGLVPAEAYTGYLTRISGHGFICIGVDILFPAKKRGLGNFFDFADKFEMNFRWLEQNLTARLDPGVIPDWSKVAFGSHSDGADGALLLVERNHTMAQAVVFYEPFSFKFINKTTFSLPALIVGTVLSKEHRGKLPPCIINGFGFDHFYDMWGKGPKYYLNIKNFGHCDILDFEIRDVCGGANICESGNTTNMNLYHDFTMGVTSAFMINTLYGYADDQKYFTDQQYIPIEMETIKYNLTSV